jgi:hypothetical protein
MQLIAWALALLDPWHAETPQDEREWVCQNYWSHLIDDVITF